MSDPTQPTESSDESPRPAPSPGATAARRARRIGGRPAPAPAPVATTAEPAPVPLAKPEPEPVAAKTKKQKKQKKQKQDDKDAPESTSSPAATVRSLPLAWFPAAVLATAAALLLGLLVWAGHGGYWDKPDVAGLNTPSTQEQETVLAAAKKCFAQLNTYDYRHLDQSLSDNLACTTGTFTSDYKVYFQSQVVKLAPTVKPVQSAQVNKAGIVSISSDGTEWFVLVFGQLSYTNSSTKKGADPTIAPVGAVVKMDRTGDKWLVGKVDTDAGNGLSS